MIRQYIDHVPILVFWLILLASTARPQTIEETGSDLKDDFGDSLPEGAVARLGTTRLYQSGHIVSLVASPDGRTAASGAFDRAGSTAIVWEIESGKVLRRFDSTGGHIAISPDGKSLATAGIQKESHVRLWSLESGALQKQIEVKGNADAAVEGIGPIAFSPDGKSLIAETWWEDDRGMPAYPRYRKVRYINLISDEEIKSFSAPDDIGYFNSPFAISPDGKWLIVVGGKERTAYLVDVSTMQIREKIGTGAQELAFSEDGLALAFADYKSIRLVDLRTLNVTRTFTDFRGRHGYMPGKIALSPDASLMAAGGDYHEPLRVYNVKTGRRVFEAPLHRGERVTCVAFSRNSSKLLSAHGDRLRVWDLARGKESTLSDVRRRELSCVRYSPNGDVLAVCGRDKGVRLHDARTRKLLREVATDESIGSLSFSADSNVIATAGMSLKLWNCKTGELLKTLQPGLDAGLALTYVEFLSNKDLLVSGGYSGTLRLWDVQNGAQIREFQQPINADHHSDPVRGAVVFPKGDRLAAIANKVYLYDLETGKLLDTFDGTAEYMRPMRPIAINSDGSLLAFPTIRYSKGPESPYNVVLHELNSKESRRLIDIAGPRSTLYETSVVFSPDGRLLATGGGDKSVRVWDVSTAKELRRFDGHRDHVAYVDFSPDGSIVVSASSDGTVLFWNVATELDGLKHKTK